MSIHGGSLYLMDEGSFVVYPTSLANPGVVATLQVIHGGRITKDSVDPENPSNLASVEGLVVSDTYFGPRSHRAWLLGKGPLSSG